MSLVLTDYRISKKAQNSLISKGFETVSLPPYNKLSEPVSAHPDMLLFILDDILFTDCDYYKIAKDNIDYICKRGGLNLTLCNENISSDYPYDISFNILACGSSLFCKSYYTSKSIINYVQKHKYTIVNVNQGYTKCSVCKVSENAIITADQSIAIAAQAMGIDVLPICEGYISLPPFKHGFIGGASGLCNGLKTLYFCGNINLHKDADAIKAFCKNHNKEIVSLSDEVLFDVGTLIFLN